MNTKPNKQWYVLQTSYMREKAAKNYLLKKISLLQLEEFFGEILIPVDTVTEMKTGKVRGSSKKIFPGYLFVEMLLTEETVALINGLPMVKNFLGNGKSEPQPLSESDAENIKMLTKEGVEGQRSKKIFKPGQLVRVTTGPFADFVGTIETVDYEKSIAKLSVYILGRTMPVEIEFTNIVPEL